MWEQFFSNVYIVQKLSRTKRHERPKEIHVNKHIVGFYRLTFYQHLLSQCILYEINLV